MTLKNRVLFNSSLRRAVHRGRTRFLEFFVVKFGIILAIFELLMSVFGILFFLL